MYSEPIPLRQVGGNWNFTKCRIPPSYQQLLEVIPNEIPLLSDTPAAQTLCANLTNDVTFTISDADQDTMQFQITSSNIALIPVANISITNMDSNYTLHYSPLASQSGTTNITITANDGYGGTVNFSFIIAVNPLPTLLTGRGIIFLKRVQPRIFGIRALFREIILLKQLLLQQNNA